MLRQIKPLIPPFLSGIILALPFANGKFWVFSWFGFLPLLIALKNKSRLQAFLVSYLTGVVFWTATIYWLIHVTLPGTILLILYLAFYFGFFGLFVCAYPLAATSQLLFIPCIWVLLEYLRGHLLTGFPWALLGYSQYLHLPILQIADITGVWGVSFLIMMVNVAVYSAFSFQLSALSKMKNSFIAALAIIFALSYGYYKLYRVASSENLTSIRISIIQGNIPQDLKWDRECRDFIIAQYLNLSRQAAQGKPDLLIWPEAALPVVLEEEPLYYEKIKDLTREIRTPVVLGAVTLRGNLYYNSSLLVSQDGQTLDIYDKLHLVPFGEYVPLRKVLWFLETIAPIGDIAAGKEFKVFKNPARFSVLICFEDLFPELSRRFVNKGAVFLVNITNDAWYKRTPAAWQHLQASVLRAVENRVPLVRCANTGVSGFIAPSGKIISLVKDKGGQNIFISGYQTDTIFVAKKPIFSFYGRFGDTFILPLLLFSLYAIFRPLRLS